jgi:hypothetical protein
MMMMMMMMMMIMIAESMNALHRLARGCFHLLDKFLKLFRDFMVEILDSIRPLFSILSIL